MRGCRPKQAYAETEAPAPPLTAPQPSNAGSAPGCKTFNEKDFVVEVPRSYKEFQDPSTSEFGAGGRPKSTYGEVAKHLSGSTLASCHC